MQVFISEETEEFDNPWNNKYYRPIVYRDENAYVGYEGQSHYILCNEFGIDPYDVLGSDVRPPRDQGHREGLMFGDGEIAWRGDLSGDWTKFNTSEPEPGINKAILDALGMSDPDFKFSWNSKMRIK